MTSASSIVTRIYWVVTIALFGAGILLAAYYAPVETTMGVVQKIFYLHLPVAITMFVACFVVFLASIAYLWHRERRWDDLAHAGAEVAVLFASVVLLTGMTWGRSAWGHWWTWSPRLTFSLILWLLYVVYLMVRTSIESPQRRAIVAAVYAIVAFLDVPLVYFSAKLLPDIHPDSISLEPPMGRTVLFWFLPVLMLYAGAIRARYRILRTLGARRDVAAEETPVEHVRAGESA
jgi:heme exporter protein C